MRISSLQSSSALPPLPRPAQSAVHTPTGASEDKDKRLRRPEALSLLSPGCSSFGGVGRKWDRREQGRWRRSVLRQLAQQALTGPQAAAPWRAAWEAGLRGFLGDRPSPQPATGLQVGGCRLAGRRCQPGRRDWASGQPPQVARARRLGAGDSAGGRGFCFSFHLHSRNFSLG